MYRKQAAKSELTFQLDAASGPPTSSKGFTPMKFPEGVQLSESQKQYLLPHFTMLVVGKPGSGKTSSIRQLLTDPNFYLHRFDQVLLVSPTASKMGIPVKKDNMNQNFSLSWIEEKLFEMNRKQAQAIASRLKELHIIDKFDTDKLSGKLGEELKSQVDSIPQQKQMPNLFADKERFFNKTIVKNMATSKVNEKAGRRFKKVLGVQEETMGGQRVDLATYVDQMYQTYYTKLPEEEKLTFCKNCLIVLDDVVSQLKANEFNPMLTQLIFNRRHLLLGGTVSLMIVSQKYTMIPARIRSNANWMLLFRLNPNDFETVFKDVVMVPQDHWNQLLDHVFGGVEKKYNSLGIWVETDDYFLNFQKLNFSTNKELT